MNKIVREHYPVSKLPEELRPGTDPNAQVTVIVEQEPADDLKPKPVMSLEEIFSLGGFRRRTKEEIDADIRRQRDEWDD